MPSSVIQFATLTVDILLSLAALAAFSRPTVRRKFPWMFAYLSVRAITAVIISFLRFGPLLASPEFYTKAYFVAFWASSVASAILLFMGCLDVYRQAMAPLQGLTRMGTTIFRWAAFASVLITATTLTSITVGPDMFLKVCVQLMRCAGTAELCLLALLLLSLNAIGLSARSRPFGMAVGLALMTAADCAEYVTAGMKFATNPCVQGSFEGAALITLTLWIVYAALPEPVSKTITVRADSTIYKWDQIASALGHKGTQVALQPAPSFFLVDVEKVVERAFVRTLSSKESES